MHVWGHVKLGCNGVLIETFPLLKGSRAEGGVASKFRLDSADDNESWDCVGFCKNACMHVWGHVKLGCNGVLIETFPLVKDSRAEGGVASKLGN